MLDEDQRKREGIIRQEEMNSGYIEKMPIYYGLIHTIYDLYTVLFSRRKIGFWKLFIW